jgi:anti-anti-sigma factor
LPVKFDASEMPPVVRLEGEIDVRCAEELKAALVDLVASGTKVYLDFGGVSEIDVTAIQLLWAAEREARQKGIALRTTAPLPESVRAILREAGFPQLLEAPPTVHQAGSCSAEVGG